MARNFKTILNDIRVMAFDVDGVLTEGLVHSYNDGNKVRVTNIKDAYALQLAIKKGLKVLIISGGMSDAIVKHFEFLGVTDVYMGSHHKMTVLEKYLKDNNLNQSQVLYMGDDIPDLELMRHVAAPCCPADAVRDIKEVSLYVSSFGGGRGCVRDVIEQVLRVQDKWLDKDAFTW